MSETIAAIATPIGEGGIGIVRLSGDESLNILKKIFMPSSGWDFTEIIPRKMIYGRVFDVERQKTIDDALAVYMKMPASYTGEDVVEINCHGSNVSLKNTLELALKNGARLAEKGEFTKRAFLNGKIDLSQAEAVMDLISAKTERGFDVAYNQLEGSLSNLVSNLRKRQMDLLVDLAVNIEYPEEDIEELTYSQFIKRADEIADEIRETLKTAESGKIIKEGIKICIVGKPNVGKSSLMNALLGENRAIVTDIAGTTRDTIAETIAINGILCELIDTAGIRETEDEIEKIGIEKTKRAFNESDLILMICSGDRKLSKEDKDILEIIGNRDALILINKKDLGTVIEKDEIKEFCPNAVILRTAVGKGDGIKEVKDEIEKIVMNDKVFTTEKVFITNARHKFLLEKSLEEMLQGIDMAKQGEALDFIEFSVRASWMYLGEIIGETVAEDIIDTIFERFCLGK